jgi:hypothetical protein
MDADGSDRRWTEEIGYPAPISGDLVRAAYATSLHRLYPFTSLNRLCFSQKPGGPLAGTVVPAYVAVTRDEGYVVWAGDPYRGEEAVLQLVTTSASQAAEAVERLLAQQQL